MGVLDQPFSLPRRSPSTSRNSAALSVIWPHQSRPRAFGSRDSRTYLVVPTKPRIPSGTFTRNTASQPRALVRAPPTYGPKANAAPIDAPYAASALTRSSGFGKAPAGRERLGGEL